ncbi:MAG: AMP-binding protein, partial [Thermoguttaceae bacterium]
MSNIAEYLTKQVRERGDAIAIVEPIPKRSAKEQRKYGTITFRELDRDSDKIAAALIGIGLQPGTRVALMVRQGIDFISLVFGLFKSGAVIVLIDPGMGMKQMINCLAEVDLQGFAALSPVHAVRVLLRARFPNARFNLTVGRRWFWGGLSLARIRQGT